MELDEHLKARMQQHKTKRESLLAEIAALKRQQQSPLTILTPQKIETVAKSLNKRLAEASPYAKAYLKTSLKEIQVGDDFIRLRGANASMARLIADNGAIAAPSTVPGFIPEWWT